MIRFDPNLVIPVLWLTSLASWAATVGHLWTARGAVVLLIVLMWAGSRE